MSRVRVDDEILTDLRTLAVRKHDRLQGALKAEAEAALRTHIDGLRAELEAEEE